MGYGSAAEPQALFLKLKELAEWNVQGLGDVDEQVYAASRGRVLHALNVVAADSLAAHFSKLLLRQPLFLAIVQYIQTDLYPIVIVSNIHQGSPHEYSTHDFYAC